MSSGTWALSPSPDVRINVATDRGGRRMNGTPRILNRVLIGVLGIKLLAIGVLLILLATVPAVGVWWQSWSAGVWSIWRDLFERTRFPGRPESWLWIVVVWSAPGGGAWPMVAWVAQQGKGRDQPARVRGGPGRRAGKCQDRQRRGRAGAPGRPGGPSGPGRSHRLPPTNSAANRRLKIRIQPRQGVAPHRLAADVSALVEALDAVLGKRTPVLIHIASGARSRFGRAERVR